MNSYTKKEAIEILQRALNKRDRDSEPAGELIKDEELISMAADLDITKEQLEQAAMEINNTVEQKRGDVFPEAVASRWIKGRLTDKEIENVLSEIRHKVGGTTTIGGTPLTPHKIGTVWEYTVHNAKILIKEEPDGYLLQVIKHQVFHGNSLEGSILAIPVAAILGLLPVMAAYEWVHLYAAIFTAVVIYCFSYFFIQKYTAKNRSDTVSKLLEVTEFAEQKLKNAVREQQIVVTKSGEEKIAANRSVEKRIATDESQDEKISATEREEQKIVIPESEELTPEREELNKKTERKRTN